MNQSHWQRTSLPALLSRDAFGRIVALAHVRLGREMIHWTLSIKPTSYDSWKSPIVITVDNG